MTTGNIAKEAAKGANPNFLRVHNPLAVNQRLFGPPIKAAFADILARTEPTEPSLAAFLFYKDDFGRVSCALAAAFGCANQQFGERRLDERHSGIFLLGITEYHDTPVQSERRHPRWHAYDRFGSFRYQAIIPGIQGVGDVTGESVVSCPLPTIIDFVREGGTAAISVDQSFITDYSDPTWKPIMKLGHVISIMRVTGKGSSEVVEITDPYSRLEDLPALRIPTSVLDAYVDLHEGQPATKGMMFVKKGDRSLLKITANYRDPFATYPEEVTQRIAELVSQGKI